MILYYFEGGLYLKLSCAQVFSLEVKAVLASPVILESRVGFLKSISKGKKCSINFGFWGDKLTFKPHFRISFSSLFRDLSEKLKITSRLLEMLKRLLPLRKTPGHMRVLSTDPPQNNIKSFNVNIL